MVAPEEPSYAFATNVELRTILFSSFESTGSDLYDRSRNRLWRFLDNQHRYPKIHLDTGEDAQAAESLIGCLATLAVLAPDRGIRQLATMVLSLHLYRTIIKARCLLVYHFY